MSSILPQQVLPGFLKNHSALAALFASLCLLSLGTKRTEAAIPAFPGAEGYGAYAVGGRNGDVYHVTNLNASGAGSFADAIATVPAAGRTIVFDVSGYIRFPSSSNGMRMTASKVTIAGQTAPGDGIGFYNNFFLISGDDIVVRHVRFRMGYNGSGGDCVDLDSGCNNAVLDHVSMEFSTDENMSSFGSPPENLTLQYSLNAWGLETHSCGGLWDQSHATSHHNLWAYNHTRNPKSRPTGLLEWINNVTYDWDIGFIMGDTESVYNFKANVINNYFISPAGNTQSKAMVKGTVATNGKPNFTIFLSGNLMDNDGDGILNGTDKGYSIVEGTPFSDAEGTATVGSYRYYQASAAIAVDAGKGITVDPALIAYKKIVSSAGALRLDANYTGTLRDEVDTILFSRLVSQTHMSYSGETGIHKESDTGASNSGFGTLTSTAAPTDTDRDGMPDYYEDALGWSKAVDDHTIALANNGTIITGTTFFPANTPAGYTRLEEYLHFLAIPHGTVPKNVSGTPSALTVDLRKYTSGFSSSPVFTVANVIGGTVALSGSGNAIATFTPTLNTTGRARFEFTVSDSQGSTWTQTFAIVISASGLPRDLVWKGDSSTNAWDTTANNWLRSGTATAFSSGDFATFDDIGSKSPAVSVGSITSSGIVVNAAGDYTFGGSGSLTGPLVKRGTGSLTISNSGVNTLTPATLEQGTLAVTSGGGLGTGTLTIRGGTLTLGISPSTAILLAGDATMNVTGAPTLSGSMAGSGTLNVGISGANTFTVAGSLSGFTGTLAFGSSSGFLRLNSSSTAFTGSQAATFDLGTGTMTLLNRNGNLTIDLGALRGGANTTLSGAGSAANVTTYSIGANNTDTTFVGRIVNGTGATAITKVGSGALTVAGTSTYTGATTVSSGALIVAGALGDTPVTVSSGAMLAGSGTIGSSTGGAVTANSGAFLSPGTAPFTGATMTVGNGLMLNAATLYFDMSGSPSGANDKIVMNGGVLTFAASPYFQFLFLNGTIGPGTYTLITGGTNTSAVGSPQLTSNLPSGTRQTFTLSRSGGGSGQAYVQLVVSGNTASLVWSGTNGNAWDYANTVNFTGSTDGTNSFRTNDAVTFDDSAASTSVVLSGSIPLQPRVATVNNNTKNYTLSGSGVLGGAAMLVKTGTGTLTISTTGTNTFSGGTFINGGTIVLADDNANANGLGSGAITFNGGTLSMYSNASTFNSATYNLVVPAGQTGTLNADARCDLYGTLTGGGTFNFYVPYVRTTLYADWSAFTGTINVITDNDGGDLRMGTSYSFPGFPQASVNLGDKVWAYYVGTLAQGAGTTIEIGELIGTAQSVLQGGGTASGSRALTYRIGGRTPAGSEATFAGTISEQGAATTTSFVKTGAGTWTLSGACSWNGGTTIEQGTLKISGSTVCGATINVNSGATLNLAGGTISADTVNIAAGATLTGKGTINSDVTNNSTITFSAGGQITITGDVVNNGTMRLTGGTALNATRSFINNGVLDLLSGAGGPPANLVNNGVVIDSSAAKVRDFQKNGSAFTLTIDSYSGHNYKMQRTNALGASTVWQDVVQPDSSTSKSGVTQSNGTPTVLSFTDSNATGGNWFYRILISP